MDTGPGKALGEIRQNRGSCAERYSYTTKGIQKHIQDLECMFTYAPVTRIKEHPVKIGQGEWTAVRASDIGRNHEGE